MLIFNVLFLFYFSQFVFHSFLCSAFFSQDVAEVAKIQLKDLTKYTKLVTESVTNGINDYVTLTIAAHLERLRDSLRLPRHAHVRIRLIAFFCALFCPHISFFSF